MSASASPSAAGAPCPDGPDTEADAWENFCDGGDDHFDTFPTHRDDAALWLFSGGTTGRPKAVIQTHGAFANTTERYARRTLGYGPQDITLSELRMETYFPADPGSAAILRGWAAH